MNVSSRLEGTAIRPWMVVATAIGLLLAVLVGVWLAIPGPDTRHDLVAPSGAARLELAELCGPDACTRVAIFERRTGSEAERRACPMELVGAEPLFADVAVQWSAEEDMVQVDYRSETGATGRLAFTFSDCLGP